MHILGFIKWKLFSLVFMVVFIIVFIIVPIYKQREDGGGGNRL